MYTCQHIQHWHLTDLQIYLDPTCTGNVKAGPVNKDVTPDLRSRQRSKRFFSSNKNYSSSIIECISVTCNVLFTCLSRAVFCILG